MRRNGLPIQWGLETWSVLARSSSPNINGNTMIIHGDCLEELKKLEENSIDTLITDPPYGLAFMGKKWDYDVPKIEVWQECLRVLKPGGTALIFAGTRTQHRMAVNVEDAGFELRDCIMWLYGSGFPKATDISKQLDKEVERKVIETKIKKAGDMTGGNFKHGGGRPDKEIKITEPKTPEAKLWNGWKSHGLKPAYEPILVAVKPNEGTYANNALQWGVSGLNIDGGRIGATTKTNGGNPNTKNNRIGAVKGYVNKVESKEHNYGRFPANIILDEEAGKMLDEQSGVSKSTGGSVGTATGFGNNFEGERKNTKGDGGFGDKGGASRFFYCAKASKSERNAGLEDFEPKKVSDGREKEADNAYQRGKTLRSNTHPTVKPLKLMEYLCTLTKTPTGGIVLDPFAGSGTTGLAAKNTGRDYILIEREAEYVEIIKARLGDKSPTIKPKPIEKTKEKPIPTDQCKCGGKYQKQSSGRICEDCMEEE